MHTMPTKMIGRCLQIVFSTLLLLPLSQLAMSEDSNRFDVACLSPTDVRQYERCGPELIEVVGTATLGFEQSNFVLKDGSNSKGYDAMQNGWCIKFSLDGDDTRSREERIRLVKSLVGLTIRAKGYLSPPGRYCHMGAYSRQFIVTEATVEPE